MSLSPTQIAAHERIMRALRHVERAQAELGQALAELSGVTGAMREWNAADKLYRSVHAFWHKLNLRAQVHPAKFDLDDMHKAKLSNNGEPVVLLFKPKGQP